MIYLSNIRKMVVIASPIINLFFQLFKPFRSTNVSSLFSDNVVIIFSHPAVVLSPYLPDFFIQFSA
jgi:hypothetical protein